MDRGVTAHGVAQSRTQLSLNWEQKATAAAAWPLQSCPTLCDPMDCSSPGFSPGNSQEY